jgi:hypothetical protein
MRWAVNRRRLVFINVYLVGFVFSAIAAALAMLGYMRAEIPRWVAIPLLVVSAGCRQLAIWEYDHTTNRKLAQFFNWLSRVGVKEN